MDTLSPDVSLLCPTCPTTLDRCLPTKSPWRNRSYTETVPPMEKESMDLKPIPCAKVVDLLFYLTQLSSHGVHRDCKGVSDLDLDFLCAVAVCTQAAA